MTAKCLPSTVLLVMISMSSAVLPASAQSTYGFLAPAGTLTEAGHPSARVPYLPQSGDLIFFTDDSMCVNLLYIMAGTGAPHHVGIVVALPDGKPAIAEAGAFRLSSVKLIDLPARLHSVEGQIHVRRLIKPLDEGQARSLNRYALEQTCKPYAYVRVVLDTTLLRSHGWLGSRLFGCASLDRSSWTCYELCVACAAAAGLLDPTQVKPNSVFVRDLFRDDIEILRTIWEPPAVWSPPWAITPDKAPY